MQKTKNKFKIKFIVTILSLIILTNVLPEKVFALTGSAEGDAVIQPGFELVPPCAKKGSNKECGYNDLIILVNKIINFLIVMSASIAVLAFCYAGFLYITAFGQAGKIEQAHGIFSKTIIGMMFVLLGWLIVATILKTLGADQGVVNTVDFSGVGTITTK